MNRSVLDDTVIGDGWGLLPHASSFKLKFTVSKTSNFTKSSSKCHLETPGNQTCWSVRHPASTNVVTYLLIYSKSYLLTVLQQCKGTWHEVVITDCFYILTFLIGFVVLVCHFGFVLFRHYVSRLFGAWHVKWLHITSYHIIIIPGWGIGLRLDISVSTHTNVSSWQKLWTSQSWLFTSRAQDQFSDTDMGNFYRITNRALAYVFTIRVPSCFC